MKILIIEDQEVLANMVKDGLESEGFAADVVYDGEEGQKRIEFHHTDYDAIILDIMLPKKDGMQICREVREERITTPILMLTSKGSNADIAAGLNAGADDYLVKPFSFEVLLARINATLRRPKVTIPTVLSAKGLTLDPVKKVVTQNGRELRLTTKEFSILEYFMRHLNELLSREQIISNLWDFNYDSFSNVVDVHINNLRKKLSDQEGKIIETVRGMGYRLAT